MALVAAPMVIEEWLEPLGVSLDSFARDMTGGWMFNYADALAIVDVHMVVICFSAWVREPRRLEHAPTGATLWIVPAGRRLERMRRWIAEPPRDGARDPASLARAVRRQVAPHATTPLRPLVRILRQERCDAILSQDYESQRFQQCTALGRMLRIPVFATFQGGFFPWSRLTDALRPLALRGCAGLVVPARRELDRVRNSYGVPETKLARIPNPLDVNAWQGVPRAAAREALAIAPEALVAITHGRVDINDKGLDVLIEAWGHVCTERADRDLRFLIVGDGPDTAEVRRLADARGVPGVHLVDEFVVDPEVLRRYLSAADVYVFAGRYEGFPVAPTEAMACGLPLVATDASGIPDLLEGGEDAGGIVVPRDDVAALADALGRLVDDPARRHELGARARRRVEEFCSLESVGRALERFFVSRGMRAR